ncbi:hypothetical protein BP6252_03624 [Coleophoma cylindrospora]|uniref:N-alpha-acetyltransferase 40 n=1 Tax=Coleophoma cylindrospora TaxID=1849047 RepID=A0A3D8S866_9HELO|nr:hypothetical protein BP6252_03624 [Coleophoma cylindrospora]
MEVSSDSIDIANTKTLDEFVHLYMPTCTADSKWTHPTSKEEYTISIQTASGLCDEDFTACFKLIELTSSQDYKKSKDGWKPRSKRKEMKLLDLKYLLVKLNDSLEGFVSFMPTYEDDYPVIYTYEIHLTTTLRGTGLASHLMKQLEKVATRIPGIEKLMLTCFTSNERAVQFYQKLGYSKDEYSPPPRQLRDGTKIEAPESQPSVAEILAHPSYKDTIWQLVPTQSGRLPVAKTRGGPLDIAWEVHGKGDIKLVWVMGLGTVMSAWQRQTLRYGHEQGEKFSSLIFDNRGMGDSDKPLLRYSTKEMALDLIELLDHLGWTKERQLHITGVSMGGMIAQEFAYLAPDRIASLNLVSTAPWIENTTTFVENLRTRINMFIPKSLDRSVTDAARSLFADSWLIQPDQTIVPTAATPGVILPPSGVYGMFDTNYERFAAQELTKRLDKEKFQKAGFMLQAIAAGWHHKSPAQLKEIADKVGRERIMVLHGTKDNMITVPHGRKLIEMMQPGVGVIKEGTGHVFMLEEWDFHNEMVEKMFATGERLNKAS